MSDVETSEDAIVAECNCVKWHSPRGPLVSLGDELVCLVTANAVDQLMAKYRVKGKIVKADQRGFTKYQRELSERVYNTPIAVVPEPESIQEPASSEA